MAVSVLLARFRTAAWLGWLVDYNWADVTVIAIYTVARPLATALILAGMYWAVRGHGAPAGAFAGFYLANAFHAMVVAVVTDMGWVIVGEREEFETLKYVVASPIGMRTYLAGRSVARFARGAASVVLALAVGWFLLGVRWDWARVSLPALAVTLALGGAVLLCTGLLVAGVTLVLSRAAMTTLEGVTLGFYLLCGVVFPIDLLPRVLQWVAFALPFTWWYEALRRVLLGHGASAAFARLTDAQLLGGFALLTVVVSAGSLWGYGALERRARELGRIDQTTLF